MRRITVLPAPLPPMTTSVVALAEGDEHTPRSTSWRSNDLRRSMASTTPRLDESAAAAFAHSQATHQNRMRKSLVRKKSEMITPIATCTTVAVVDRPSPSVPPSVASPL